MFAALLLGGCIDAHVPEYKRPDTPAKTSWTDRTGATISAASTIEPDWWKAFQDPYLNSLIGRSIDGNFDIKILAARINVAGAQIAEAHAGALPTMDLGAGASFEKTTGQPFSRTYNLGTQVNWDIDIWGKVEKGVQAQKAEFHATGPTGAPAIWNWSRTCPARTSRSCSSTTRSKRSKRLSKPTARS